MASRKARTRATRRDRRLAKQSEWRRPGRSNPKKVGHGGSGQLGTGHKISSLLDRPASKKSRKIVRKNKPKKEEPKKEEPKKIFEEKIVLEPIKDERGIVIAHMRKRVLIERITSADSPEETDSSR